MVVKLKNRTGTQLLATAKRDGSRLFNEQAELNASSKADAFAQVAHIMDQMSKGLYVTEAQDKAVDSREKAKESRELLLAAWHDKQGDMWSEVGAEMAGRLSEAMDRQGFMRRLFIRCDVAQGGIPRIPVMRKNVVGFISTGVTQASQYINRDQYITPPEFYVRGHVFVEEKEITQGVGDVLETKYLDAQEAIMVQEDRTWKTLADGTLGVANPLVYGAGAFTPQYLASLSASITRWQLQPTTLLIASDILPDIQTDPSFTSWFDPVTKLEIVQTGMIGKILGLDLITDAYRHPTLHVLASGEVYALSAPNTLGGYTDRGPVQATAIDGFAQMQAVPGRGWNMLEQLSMVLANSRAVAKLQKIAQEKQ